MAIPAAPVAGEYLLQQEWCRELVAKGLIKDLGKAGAPWLPTTSSRSLYCATSSDMIKFSLSVRLTNSVRTLSVKEVKRGMRPRAWRKPTTGRRYRLASRLSG